MGSKHSKTERWNPAHIFTTPAEVRSQLLHALHREPELHLDQLRAIFESRASTADTNCPYWTKETFIAYLASQNPDAELQIRNAGPLLYKMAIHYGSFPFPPTKDARMTGEIFLLGVAMLSRLYWSLFWKDYGFIDERPRNQQRKPVDDIRILFQCMAMHGSPGADLGDRIAGDDEDLLDVMFVAMEIRRRDLQSLAGYERRHFIPAARQLPSSRSRDLDGWVGVDELRGLFELVVMLSMRFVEEKGEIGTIETVECLMNSFLAHADGTEKIGWEAFRKVVLHSFPNLLRLLLGFFERTFQITPWFCYEDDLLPLNPHIHGVLSTSKILSVERLSQLLLTLPGALALHFKDVLFQGAPSDNHVDIISSLVSSPGRLLLVKGTNFIDSPKTKGQSIMAIYTGATADMFSGHGLTPSAWQNGAIVASLAPIHAVFHAPRIEKDGSILDVQRQDDGVTFSVGEVVLSLVDGLTILKMKTRSVSFQVTVEAIEVWGM